MSEKIRSEIVRLASLLDTLDGDALSMYLQKVFDSQGKGDMSAPAVNMERIGDEFLVLSENLLRLADFIDRKFHEDN